MPSFNPTFQDFVNSLGRDPDMTEAMWNGLSDQDKWAQAGGSFELRPDDPRYADLHQLVGGETGRNIYLRSTPMGADDILPGREYRGDNFFAHSQDAQTPHFQASSEASMLPIFALPLAFMGAGALMGGGGPFAGLFGSSGAGAAEGATGAFDIGGSSGFGGATALSGGEAAAGSAATSGNWLTRALTSVGMDPGTASALNTGRQGLSALNMVSRVLGGSTGTRSTTMPGSSGFDLSSIGGILGLLGLGRSSGLYGNGIGTPSGAIDVGNRAADRADPWGANGHREGFSNILTPEYVQSLLNPDPSSIRSDPAYQFQLQEGTNAINAGDAAQGSLHSGNRLYELEKYGSGLASDFAQRQLTNNLGRLGVLGKFGGVDASNPAAAGASLVGAFEGATSLQNNGLNGLLSQLMGGGTGGLLNLLGRAGSGISGLLGGLLGNNDIDWESILSSGGGSISDNLFPGADNDLGIWDALAGP